VRNVIDEACNNVYCLVLMKNHHWLV